MSRINLVAAISGEISYALIITGILGFKSKSQTVSSTKDVSVSSTFCSSGLITAAALSNLASRLPIDPFFAPTYVNSPHRLVYRILSRPRSVLAILVILQGTSMGLFIADLPRMGPSRSFTGEC